jgi:hypothetical protein
MSVDSTTRRRPGRDGASAASCSASAGQREHVDVGCDRLAQHRLRPADLADPREEHQHVAGLLA